MTRILLLSTYELGRQPFGLASPAAWLRRGGADVTVADLSRDPLPESAVRTADLVAWYLPMHTATRLAVPIIQQVRRLNSSAHLACYGLYAALNTGLLRSLGVGTVIGAEFEADLEALARRLPGAPRQAPPDEVSGPSATLPRLRFLTPDRRGLPSLDRYAKLAVGDGRQRVVGYTEASRGCKHVCRHCPIVPIYNGRFRIVRPDVVQADIRAQVAAGAQHITFGDPDFFNGPAHAMKVVHALAREWPELTYDVTIKIEHLLRHRDLLETLRETGCLFVTSAVESLDDEVLRKLEKGHTRADFVQAVHLCQAAGVRLVPTFVAFTPWTTHESYLELLETIDRLDLVSAVAPIQLAIRLLVTAGSRLLDLDDVRRLVGPYDAERLVYPWTHPDPRVDALQDAVARLVGTRARGYPSDLFDAITQLACRHAGIAFTPSPGREPRLSRAAVPYLTEPWYC